MVHDPGFCKISRQITPDFVGHCIEVVPDQNIYDDPTAVKKPASY
jgi:hypothetical protein